MQRHMLASVFVALPLAARPRRRAGPRRPLGGLELAALDRTAEPVHRLLPVRLRRLDGEQSDPADRSRWGRFDELPGTQQQTLRTHPRDAAAPAATPTTKKIGDYYASCMDEAGIERRARAPLDPPT